MTCEFQVFGYAQTSGHTPEVLLRKQSVNEVVKFVGMKGRRPKLKTTAATIDLDRVMDDGDQVVLIERNKAGSAFVYAISRATRVGIWSKAQFLPDRSPLAIASVGLCY